jgi:EAL domain-containing protein (putative c-di-GMP-specific phosphodiesterase class I)
LQVTAQGIETQAQRSFLIGLDCQVFQGEVFGSVEPALEMLHKYTNKIALEHDGRALKAINWGALI